MAEQTSVGNENVKLKINHEHLKLSLKIDWRDVPWNAVRLTLPDCQTIEIRRGKNDEKDVGEEEIESAWRGFLSWTVTDSMAQRKNNVIEATACDPPTWIKNHLLMEIESASQTSSHGFDASNYSPKPEAL